MKIWMVLIGASCCATFVCMTGICQTASPEIDWDYMGVRPIRDLAQDEEIKLKDIEQVSLSKNTSISIRCDNVKSTMSAVDRRTKRALKKGELLLYSDLGTQRYVVERYQPEFQSGKTHVISYPYGPKP